MKFSIAVVLTATLVYKVSAGCFSESLGYNCCKGCDVVTTDEKGIYKKTLYQEYNNNKIIIVYKIDVI